MISSKQPPFPDTKIKIRLTAPTAHAVKLTNPKEVYVPQLEDHFKGDVIEIGEFKPRYDGATISYLEATVSVPEGTKFDVYEGSDVDAHRETVRVEEAVRKYTRIWVRNNRYIPVQILSATEPQPVEVAVVEDPPPKTSEELQKTVKDLRGQLEATTKALKELQFLNNATTAALFDTQVRAEDLEVEFWQLLIGMYDNLSDSESDMPEEMMPGLTEEQNAEGDEFVNTFLLTVGEGVAEVNGSLFPIRNN